MTAAPRSVLARVVFRLRFVSPLDLLTCSELRTSVASAARSDFSSAVAFLPEGLKVLEAGLQRRPDRGLVQGLPDLVCALGVGVVIARVERLPALHVWRSAQGRVQGCCALASLQ